MKKIIRNHSAVVSEVAHQIAYSLKVLMIGLFIPLVFLFGISYKTTTANDEGKIKIEKQEVAVQQPSIDLSTTLPYQNA
ncbi:MAG: hypothetical protein ACTHK8_09525 [Ginsengibacter sp.]